jgi:poly(A) polymerase
MDGSASGHRYPRPVTASETPTGAVLDVPALAKELGARFAESGHELYLVGGTVRDLILGRPAPDWDTLARRPRSCRGGPTASTSSA